MQKLWPFVSGALAAALVGVLLHSAPTNAASEKGPTLSDRLAIDDLMSRYSTGLDTLQPDLYAGTFTEDANFGEGERARHGRTEIRKVITELIESRAQRAAAAPAPTPASAPAAPPAAGARPAPPAGPPMMHHVITNGAVEFLNDHQAKHHAYWMTVIGSGRSFSIAAMGHYEDELVKKDGRWYFSSRKILR